MSENKKVEKKIEKITAIKGMNDMLPADAPLWELFENTSQSVFNKSERLSLSKHLCLHAVWAR
jgi:hypothetical protein